MAQECVVYKKIRKCRYIKTPRGRKIVIESFFAILISTLGRFNRRNKKSVIYPLKKQHSIISFQKGDANYVDHIKLPLGWIYK